MKLILCLLVGPTKYILVHQYFKEWLPVVTDGGFKNSEGHQSFSQAVGHRIFQYRKQPSCCLYFNLNNITISGAANHTKGPLIILILVKHVNILSLFLEFKKNTRTC